MRSSRARGVVVGWLQLSALCALVTSAQDVDLTLSGGIGETTKKQGAYTLKLISETEWFDAAMAAKIVSTFFETYAQECETFNTSCAKLVTIRIKPEAVQCGPSTAMACTVRAEIAIAADTLWYNPEDYDMVTHEAMHVVQQGYLTAEDCWYWDEGIADVARARFGVNNVAAGWMLAYDPTQSYTDGYTSTAHFLEWIKDTYQYDVTVNLDSQLRAIGCPDDIFWEKQTTLGLDALWNEYLKVFDPDRAAPVDPSTFPTPGDEDEAP